MKDLTSATPKHMLPVAGKPVLEHVVTRLRDAGIDRQVILTGYLAEAIEDYFGDGSRFGVQITYTRQSKLDGTGSAVHSAREAIGAEPFLMTFGDVLASTATYRGLLEDFQSQPCDILLALNWVEDPCNGAAVYLDESGQVVRIIEKPPAGESTTNWNQAGIFLFSPRIFEYTARLSPSPRGEYELTEAVSMMLGDCCRIRGYRMSGVWCDVGRPDDIGKAGKLLEAEK